MILLDSDHLSLLQARESPAAFALQVRLEAFSPDEVVTTVITMEEQMRGWLALTCSASQHTEAVLQALTYKALAISPNSGQLEARPLRAASRVRRSWISAAPARNVVVVKSWVRTPGRSSSSRIAACSRIPKAPWSAKLVVQLPHVHQDHPLTAKAPAVPALTQWRPVHQPLTSRTAPPQDAAVAAAPQTRQGDGPPIGARPSAYRGAATRHGQLLFLGKLGGKRIPYAIR